MYRLDAKPGVIGIVMRHGKTIDNDPKHPVVRGWKDSELDPKGRIQAQLAAYKLQEYAPKRIFHSDFMRDTETANIISIILNIPREPDFDARTWDVGLYSGKPEAEANPPIVEIYKHPWMTPPGSTESFNEFSRRFVGLVERKLQYVTAVEAERPFLIVAHGRCVAIVQSHLEGLNAWDCDMPLTAGFATISVAPDKTLTMEFVTPTEPVVKDV